MALVGLAVATMVAPGFIPHDEDAYDGYGYEQPETLFNAPPPPHVTMMEQYFEDDVLKNLPLSPPQHLETDMSNDAFPPPSIELAKLEEYLGIDAFDNESIEFKSLNDHRNEQIKEANERYKKMNEGMKKYQDSQPVTSYQSQDLSGYQSSYGYQPGYAQQSGFTGYGEYNPYS